MTAVTASVNLPSTSQSGRDRATMNFVSERGLTVRRFESADATAWDQFVRSGKNATFLFERGYVDYHSSRFDDHSLMIYQAQRLVAVLPANLAPDRTLHSHGGLTYGGFVLEPDARLMTVLEVFRATLQYLATSSIPRLLYKRVPRFYNIIPDDEVDYALFLLKSELVRRDCALVIPQQHRLPFSKRRRREINKGTSASLELGEDGDFRGFWTQILEPRLRARFNVAPVHSVDEIMLLAQRFPQHIRQFSARSQGSLAAGVTIYETPTVAHVQYSAMAEAAQSLGALDCLVNYLVTERFADKLHFDFGICNENSGLNLNHGLLDWKEGFGARSASHDFYLLDTQQFARLDSAMVAN